MDGGFSSRRLDNIRSNQQVLTELGAVAQAGAIRRRPGRAVARAAAVADGIGGGRAGATGRGRVGGKKEKKKRIQAAPTRASARIASAPGRQVYNDDGEDGLAAFNAVAGTSARRARGRPRKEKPAAAVAAPGEEGQGLGGGGGGGETPSGPDLLSDIPALQASWASWTPTAPPPTRDETGGVLRFASHPDFTPNKTPSEVLCEGAFGGAYFRPLYSKRLRAIVSGDHAELPPTWTAGLDASRYLISERYNPDANKFKVTCGQSIEEWEAAGWIDHRFDVRGWFQWYCRFYLGRRCEDDERQVGRWRRCVGEMGRWRRALLKKYVAAGVREVWDDGSEEETMEVSPVMHQTCHHWAFEVTQDVLDEFWMTGR